MARAIGYIKSFENGTFYVRDIKGNVHQLKAGETINEGDHVYGAYGNTADAKIVIDVLLDGAGDVILAGDGALQFESALLANIFSHHDAVIHINSLSDALALSAAAEAQMHSASEEKIAAADVTEAGDETAAGNTVTDTERMTDTFAARDGAITDVTTDLRTTTPNAAETTASSMETTLLAVTEPLVTPPPPPPPVVEASAPTLDVALGEPTQLVTPVNSNADAKGYNLHTHNSTTGDIKFDGSATSVTIGLKSYKTDVDDGQILLKDHEGKVIETINIDSLFNDADPHNQPVTISIDTPFYALEVQNFVNAENINSEFKVESINADMVSYQYPLNIIDATLTDSTEVLGDVIVTGLPAGAILTHDVYDDMTVPQSGVVTFGSDTDFTSWTLTMDKELPQDSSIIASLTSTESDGSSATAYVGVYGDNTIVGSAGNDSIDGREGNDSLSGGGGDDILIGGIGSDSLHGEGGNDALVYDSHDITIDGGTGTDTLVLIGNSNIDFHTLVSNVNNIEVIDLTSGDHDLTSITFADVVNMTESGNSNIYILGDGADQVGFLNSGEWSQTGTAVSYDVNGTSYMFNEYTSVGDPTVMVRVETDIPVI
ncbi:MAG: hypothetical protein PHQ22_08085 [Sulfuricurvum sp.]|nr:hypothetical protein [Sulfuricurvum sp.]MDD5387134.1 hypothetical protein [Sulfuricurvum sp.]